MTSNWHCFKCDYIATKNYNDINLTSKMHVIDWVYTGAKEISIDSIGHFWKSNGYEISNQSYKEVEKPLQENAIIVFLS